MSYNRPLSSTEYRKRKTLVKTGFGDGSLPDWLEDNSTGGASVTVEPENGGRAKLSTGTNAEGDKSEIRGKKFYTADAFDALYIRVLFDQKVAFSGPAEVDIALTNESVSDGVYHTVLDGGGESGTIRHRADSSDQFFDTVDYIEDQVAETELILDTVNERTVHRYQDRLARGYVTSNFPDPTDDYRPRCYIQTNNTGEDRIMNVYQIEIGYADLMVA